MIARKLFLASLAFQALPLFALEVEFRGDSECQFGWEQRAQGGRIRFQVDATTRQEVLEYGDDKGPLQGGTGKITCRDKEKSLELTLKNGALDGAVKLRAYDGSRFQGKYRAGKRVGPFEFRDREGRVTWKGTYENGQLEGSVTAYEYFESVDMNGKKTKTEERLQTDYKKGVPQQEEAWAASGLKHRTTYRSGKPESMLTADGTGAMRLLPCRTPSPDAPPTGTGACTEDFRASLTFDRKDRLVRYQCPTEKSGIAKIDKVCGFDGKSRITLYDVETGGKTADLTLEKGKKIDFETTYHRKGGAIAKVDKIATGREDRVTAYFTESGKLVDIRCPTKRIAQEPFASSCGFGGVKRLKTYNREGKVYADFGLLDGQLHGAYLEYQWRDEKPATKASFDRGVAKGEARRWNAAGKVVEIVQFVKGQPSKNSRPYLVPDVGTVKRFDDAGILSEEKKYDGGRVVVLTRYYQNGQRRKVTTFAKERPKDSKPESYRVELFRDDGTLAAEAPLLGETLHGSVKRFGPDGKALEVVEQYTQGRRESLKRYAADGTVTCEETFFPDGSRKSKGTGAKNPPKDCAVPEPLTIAEPTPPPVDRAWSDAAMDAEPPPPPAFNE